MITIQNLVKKYQNKKILNDVNLSINTPAIIGIIGGNGAGKTTLLKCISQLITDYSGTIHLQDRVTFSIEYPAFFENVSLKDNLEILEQLISNRSDVTTKEALHYVGLDGHENKKFKELSLGMKQKLVIARMMLSNDSIYLMDEPFNGLDIHSSNDLKNLIQSLRDKGKIVIISSHILGELGMLCDIVWHIRKDGTIDVIDLNDRSRKYALVINESSYGKFMELNEYYIQEDKKISENKRIMIVHIDENAIVPFLQKIVQNGIEVLEYKDITNDLGNYMIEENTYE